MKRFKLFFHITYILITLVVMYFSLDILLNTEEYLSRIKLSSYIKFPKYLMGLFLFLSVLMVIEYVMQQVIIQKVKSKVSGLEKQIMELKAKLYDEGKIEIPENSLSGEADSVSREEEEKEE